MTLYNQIKSIRTDVTGEQLNYLHIKLDELNINFIHQHDHEVRRLKKIAMGYYDDEVWSLDNPIEELKEKRANLILHRQYLLVDDYSFNTVIGLYDKTIKELEQLND